MIALDHPPVTPAYATAIDNYHLITSDAVECLKNATIVHPTHRCFYIADSVGNITHINLTDEQIDAINATYHTGGFPK